MRFVIDIFFCLTFDFFSSKLFPFLLGVYTCLIKIGVLKLLGHLYHYVIKYSSFYVGSEDCRVLK